MPKDTIKPKNIVQHAAKVLNVFIFYEFNRSLKVQLFFNFSISNTKATIKLKNLY